MNGTDKKKRLTFALNQTKNREEKGNRGTTDKKKGQSGNEKRRGARGCAKNNTVKVQRNTLGDVRRKKKPHERTEPEEKLSSSTETAVREKARQKNGQKERDTRY